MTTKCRRFERVNPKNPAPPFSELWSIDGMCKGTIRAQVNGDDACICHIKKCPVCTNCEMRHCWCPGGPLDPEADGSVSIDSEFTKKRRKVRFKYLAPVSRNVATAAQKASSKPASGLASGKGVKRSRTIPPRADNHSEKDVTLRNNEGYEPVGMTEADAKRAVDALLVHTSSGKLVSSPVAFADAETIKHRSSCHRCETFGRESSGAQVPTYLLPQVRGKNIHRTRCRHIR